MGGALGTIIQCPLRCAGCTLHRLRSDAACVAESAIGAARMELNQRRRLARKRNTS
ncbi:hypothetical protein OH492_16650 [Vibrio chagasii]|nr:hypothetical protein [Vibrio chagasii]